MNNLWDEVQDEGLKLAFARGMNNHPKVWEDIRWGPSIEAKVYTTQVCLKEFSNMDFGKGMDLLYVPWNCCLRGGFYLCVEHFEDALEQRVVNDSERSKALEHPTWYEISKFGLIVCRSTCVTGNALWRINSLALAELDVTNKVCSGVFLAFTSQNDGRVSIALWDQMCKNKIKMQTYVQQTNWYFMMLFSTVITGALKWL